MSTPPLDLRSPLCDSPAEERASLWTHGLGTVLAVVALVQMLAVSGSRPLHLLCAGVFGGSLVLVYLVSSLYHACSAPRTKALLQYFDHACIYLLIAGSYTPLTLVALRGAWGWSLFGVVWFLAVAGVLSKALTRGKKESRGSTLFYLAMGWLVVLAARPVMQALPAAGLAWLVAGGISYSLGVIFFAWNRLPYNHAIWHLFVIGGSACHVVTTALYILR